MKDNFILRVREGLCLGCGLCAETCPRQAISLQWGQAQIDQSRCNNCCLCLDVCPRGAIVEMVPVSKGELKATISELKSKANDIIARIEMLKANSEVEQEKA